MKLALITRVAGNDWYCLAVLRRVGGGFQKLIVPEVVIAGLPEKRAAAAWKFWFELAPQGWRKKQIAPAIGSLGY